MRDWNPTLGAMTGPSGTIFRVWAPARERVELVLYSHDGAPEVRPLTRTEDGYWSAHAGDAPAGARYRYRLDGRDDLVFPDPASRSQPEGVHGPSLVIDPRCYRWRDGDWRPPRLEELTVYELHVGTFTPEGTFGAAADRLPYLADVGVSAIELMPVGDFPGRRNWGYDGVAIFAPARCYGTPDDLRALVDRAHAHGLAVILDVVYNHLGPDGAYAHAYSPYYFTDRHRTAWGDAVNLDGPHSEPVRRFFIENALHWIREYHIDALRLDATHALHDESPTHFLAELTDVVREHAGRRVIMTAEDHRNLARMLQPTTEGGLGIDAVWADDFHHQLRVHLAGDREGYYEDYTGSAEDLAETVRRGWFFTGQYSTHMQRPRGTPPAGLPPARFIYCIQNHDQVGNRADGARLHHHVDAASYRAASTLLLLAPETPLLFMGQEWATRAPFQYFTDHHEELGRLVTEGRRQEFAGFAAFGATAGAGAVPDPQDRATFERSRVRWEELAQAPHAAVLALYRRLLTLRRQLPLRQSGAVFDAQSLDPETVLLQTRAPATGSTEHTLVVVRLSGAGRVGLPRDAVRHGGSGAAAGPAMLVTLLTTEDEDLALPGVPIVVEPPAELDGCWAVVFERPGGIVLRVAADL